MTRLTWADRRRQFGRLVRAGLTEPEAKDAMPLWQKCTSSFIRRSGSGGPAGQSGQ